jgi:hypothetical protein
VYSREKKKGKKLKKIQSNMIAEVERNETDADDSFRVDAQTNNDN